MATKNNTEWETNWIRIAPIFSGSLSAVSSSLIIYVILRSETGLSSIYHRIMFGMSLADVMSSISIALSLLPMPSYMPMEEELEYRWSGMRMGNTATCNAQGFFIFFGVACMANYNAMLCVYYACAIAFTMEEQKIKKRVEPFLHGIPVVVALLPSLFFLYYKMYNVQLGNTLPYTAWCVPSVYPHDCYVDGECLRGDNASQLALIIGSSMSAFCLTTIVVSLALVIRKVVTTERMLFGSTSEILNIQDFVEKHSNTKAVLIQALLYIGAYLVCVCPPFIRVLAEQRKLSDDSLLTLFFMVLLLFPLQGFFNFLIFMFHKVYNYRRLNRTVPIRKVIWMLFCTSTYEPCFISRISILRSEEDSFYDENADKRQEVIEVVTNDEGCSETMRYRLNIMSKAMEGSSVERGPLDKVPTDVEEEEEEDDGKSEKEYMSGVSGVMADGSSGISFDSVDLSYPSQSPLSLMGEGSKA